MVLLLQRSGWVMLLAWVRWWGPWRMLTLALHAGAALHRGYAMSPNCVTGIKANETGHLVKGVTRVTPVAPVLEGGWICALMLPFQIGPTPHCWPLGWVIALHLTAHLHCTCPIVRIGLGQRTHGGGLFSLPMCRAYSLPCYADSAIRRVDKMLYGIK